MTVTSVTKLSPPPPSQDPYAFAQWMYQAYTILTNTLQLAGLLLPISIINGGTGSSTLSGAQANLGIPSNASPLPVTTGGTGLNSLNQGDLLYGSAANTFSALAKNTSATRYLANTGTSNTPLWDLINLANGVTGNLPVTNGGTGLNSTTAYALLCGGTTSTGNIQQVASLGTTGQVLTSNGTGALPSFQYGKVVQRVYTETGAVATGTTTIPNDDTIPQNTEGDQYMSLNITPVSTSNILEIKISANISPSVSAWVIGALFQDTTANALAASRVFIDTGTAGDCLTFTHTMVAGTTSVTSFKFRAGMNNVGTLTFNGSSSARSLGGVMASSVIITEYTP